MTSFVKRRKTASKTASLAQKTTELAWAAPQVVAHRVMRMATAGVQPSARDRREFQLMGAEKAQAFAQSWQAMAWQGLKQQQQLAASLMGGWARAPSTGLVGLGGSGDWTGLGALTRATQAIVASGLDPVHRKAVANARRLGGAKRR